MVVVNHLHPPQPPPGLGVAGDVVMVGWLAVGGVYQHPAALAAWPGSSLLRLRADCEIELD